MAFIPLCKTPQPHCLSRAEVSTPVVVTSGASMARKRKYVHEIHEIISAAAE